MPAAPLRALGYTSAGGSFANIGGDNKPMSSLMKSLGLWKSPKSGYSNPFKAQVCTIELLGAYGVDDTCLKLPDEEPWPLRGLRPGPSNVVLFFGGCYGFIEAKRLPDEEPWTADIEPKVRIWKSLHGPGMYYRVELLGALICGQ